MLAVVAVLLTAVRAVRRVLVEEVRVEAMLVLEMLELSIQVVAAAVAVNQLAQVG
jgi:hypothetical protein